jgi:predicted phage terminase large subunit-like protein
MGKNPELKVLVASYGDTLALEHAQAFKALVETEWYQAVFPAFKLKSPKVANLTTTSRGFRKAISVNGAVTGLGADIIVIDDIIKAADARSEVEREHARDFLNEGLFSRLDKKDTGHIVAIQQRFHEDDPAAYMAQIGFNLLCLRAIAEEDEEWDIGGQIWHRRRNEPLFPELESLATLEAIRQRVTPAVFSAQYQQNPINPGGNQISWQQVGFYPAPYPRSEYIKVLQGWDTASTAEPTSDYSACATLGLHISGEWHVLDIHRARYTFFDLEEAAARMINRWSPQYVLIESANTGYALIDRLRQRFRIYRPSRKAMHIHGMPALMGKSERFFARQEWLEKRRVLLPESSPWLSDFRHELLAFPSGRHDDQIDALFQLFEFLETPRGRAFMNRDPETGRSPGSRRLRRRYA